MLENIKNKEKQVWKKKFKYHGYSLRKKRFNLLSSFKETKKPKKINSGTLASKKRMGIRNKREDNLWGKWWERLFHFSIKLEGLDLS